MPHQTADVIALILALVVAVVVVATAVTLLAVELLHPDQDTIGAAEAIGRIVSVLIAALVGYMAGRAAKPNGGS